LGTDPSALIDAAAGPIWGPTPGQDKAFGPTVPPLTVRANVAFTVSASATNGGTLAEWDGSAFVPGGAQLANPLRLRIATGPELALSGVPQTCVTGAAAGQPAGGLASPTTFLQRVGAGDPPVAAPHSYHAVVTFEAAAAF
jgi:hypothetical protein